MEFTGGIAVLPAFLKAAPAAADISWKGLLPEMVATGVSDKGFCPETPANRPYSGRSVEKMI